MPTLSKLVAATASAALAGSIATAVAFSGCANNNGDGFADSGTGPGSSESPVCVTDQDCNGGTCAQFGSDIFCAPPCPKGNECSSDRTCSVETSATGEQVSVCTPNDNACGAVQNGDAGPNPSDQPPS